MDDSTWLIFTLIRIVVPLIILKRPLLGIFACMAVDYIDFGMLPLEAPSDYKMYQVWDKVLDSYYLAFAAYIAYFWKDTLARRLALLSFAYRIVGALLLVITNDQSILLLFPNFFENLFIFYLVFRLVEKREELFNSSKHFVIIFLAIIVPKMFQEFSLHVHSGLRPLSLGIELRIHILHYASIDILPIALYIGLPLLALAWRLRKHIPPRVNNLRMSLNIAAFR